MKQEEHCWTEPDNLILQACPSEPENHPCTDFPSTQFETNKTFGQWTNKIERISFYE